MIHFTYICYTFCGANLEREQPSLWNMFPRSMSLEWHSIVTKGQKHTIGHPAITSPCSIE
eukprot:c30377_g1_i1 orf=56-235(+)